MSSSVPLLLDHPNARHRLYSVRVLYETAEGYMPGRLLGVYRAPVAQHERVLQHAREILTVPPVTEPIIACDMSAFLRMVSHELGQATGVIMWPDATFQRVSWDLGTAPIRVVPWRLMKRARTA